MKVRRDRRKLAAVTTTLTLIALLATPAQPAGATAPVTYIDSGPPAYSASTTAAFTLHASSGSVETRCAVDTQPFIRYCPSPVVFTGLEPGLHTFAASSRDGAGAWGPFQVWQWTIDVTAPDATITGTPQQAPGSLPGFVNSTSATFLFSSSDTTATFQCRLDSSAFAPCIPPLVYNGLAQAPHVVQMRAVDPAGNVSSVAAFTWTVDVAAPTVTINSGPANGATILKSDVDFTLSASEPDAQTECQIIPPAPNPAQPWGPCTSPLHRWLPGPGAYTFEFRARDHAGNLSPVVARTFTADPTQTEIFLTTDPGQTSTPDVAFAFEATKPSSFECRLDPAQGGYWDDCQSPQVFNGLEDGWHTFEVRGTDVNGVAIPKKTHQWRVDGVRPDTVIDQGPPSPSALAGATFVFHGVFDPIDQPPTFQCQVDGRGWATCLSPFSEQALGEGTHLFEVRARDAAGNRDNTPAQRTWVIDFTPDTVIDSGPIGTVPQANPWFTFHATSANDTFTCSLDAGPWVNCGNGTSGNWSTGPLADGPHTVQIRATFGGRTDPTPASRSFTVDTVAPVTVLDAVPLDPSEPLTTFEFHAEEAGAPVGNTTFACRLDAGPFAPCTSPFDSPPLTLDTHTFEVRATDVAGNQGPATTHNWWVAWDIRPDLMIDELRDPPHWISENEFSSEGVLAKLVKARPGRTVWFQARAVNLGSVDDTYFFTGGMVTPSAWAKVWIYDRTTGAEVTPAVISGTHASPLLSPADDHELLIKVKLTNKVNPGKTVRVRLLLQSLIDLGDDNMDLGDLVEARVRVT